MDLGRTPAMDNPHKPTVEQSLCALSDALCKATDDMKVCRRMIDRARDDLATRATSISRDVVRDAERVVKSLSDTDESLRDVLKDLTER
jgi:cob(I)alamin adenosyltransferase